MTVTIKIIFVLTTPFFFFNAINFELDLEIIIILIILTLKNLQEYNTPTII
jgi:hypothetical protein